MRVEQWGSIVMARPVVARRSSREEEALLMDPTNEKPPPDRSLIPTGQTTSSEHTSTLRNRATWMRGLFMLLLLLAFGVAQGLLWVTALVQFLWLLFAGEPNAAVARFGRSLSRWLADTGRYLMCASEVKPFPWAPWPSAD
jgi:hypothetical protein